MNDTFTLLLATVVLSIGGLGLYIYKSTEENENDTKKGGYNESEIFGTDAEQDDYNEEEDEVYETKVRSRSSKTKRNKKGLGTKRRY